MPVRRNAVGWRLFDTVEEFWEAEVREDEIAWVERDGFQGWLAKGVVGDGPLGNLKTTDRGPRCRYNAIIVRQLHNPCRYWNWEFSPNPPPRTGRFDAFMDEVESVAVRSGLQFVRIEKVANEFLPSKFEGRGYKRIEGFPNPSFVKKLFQ